jgi:hypothetical protein
MVLIMPRPPLQAAGKLPGIQKVLALKGPLEAMMEELSGGQAQAQQALLLQQDGSPHLAASPQPAVTIQELSDSCGSPLKLVASAAAAAAATTSAEHMAFAAGQYQQHVPLPMHESLAQQVLLDAAVRLQGGGSPHTPHDARVSTLAACMCQATDLS